MSDILASVSVVLGADISAFRAGMAQARKELKGLVQAGEAMKDLGRSLSTYVTVPLLALGAGAIAASGKIESLRNALNSISQQDLAKQGATGVAALGEAASLTTERMKELEVLARAPGLGFEQAVQGDVRLRAVGISAEQSAKSLKAFANAIATTGGGKSEFDRVTVQLAQLSAKGKVLAQDLRPIIEAAPAVSAALQKLYGTVDSEDISKQLQKQGQSSTDFIAVLTDELGKIPQVAGGLKNGLENLGDTVTISLAKIGDGISKALNLPAVLAGISDFITRIGDAFSTLSPGAQKLAVSLGVAAAAAGPLLLAFGTVLTVLPSMVTGFGILTGAVSVSLAPIALGAAAIAAAAFLIIDNWAVLATYFSPSGEGGRVFGDLAERIGQSAATIGNIFSALGSLGTNSLGGLVAGLRPIQEAVREIGDGFTGLLDTVNGTVNFIIDLLSGEFRKALEDITTVADGLSRPFRSLFGLIEERGTSISNFFKGQFVAALEDASVAAFVLGGDLEKALGSTKLGLLQRLKDELKAVKEALDTEPTEKAIAADNRRIESLEKQIAALEKLGKSSKALAELQKALAENDNLSRALGSDYEFLKGKLSAVESGIKKLIAEGWSPYSATVRGLVAQQRELNTVLGDNAQLAARLVKGLEPKDAPELKVKVPELAALPETLKTGPVDTTATKASLTEFQAFLGGFQVSLQAAGEQMAQALGGALSGIGQNIGVALANGTSVAEAAGQALLKALGDLLVQFGEKLLLFSIGSFATGNIPLGVAQAAAGTALVAGGAYVGATAGGGYSGANKSTNYSQNANAGQNAAPLKIQVEVTGTLRSTGKDLVAVLSAQDYRRLRTS
ncbi:tape measure domain-containing protein [Hymenobacter sp. UYAg731]